MRHVLMLLLLAGILAGSESELTVNDPAGTRRFELALPHAYYEEYANEKFKWLAGKVVVSVAGPGKTVTAWAVIERRPEKGKSFCIGGWKPGILVGDRIVGADKGANKRTLLA